MCPRTPTRSPACEAKRDSVTPCTPVELARTRALRRTRQVVVDRDMEDEGSEDSNVDGFEYFDVVATESRPAQAVNTVKLEVKSEPESDPLPVAPPQPPVCKKRCSMTTHRLGVSTFCSEECAKHQGHESEASPCLCHLHAELDRWYPGDESSESSVDDPPEDEEAHRRDEEWYPSLIMDDLPWCLATPQRRRVTTVQPIMDTGAHHPNACTPLIPGVLDPLPRVATLPFASIAYQCSFGDSVEVSQATNRPEEGSETPSERVDAQAAPADTPSPPDVRVDPHPITRHDGETVARWIICRSVVPSTCQTCVECPTCDPLLPCRHETPTPQSAGTLAYKPTNCSHRACFDNVHRGQGCSQEERRRRPYLAHADENSIFAQSLVRPGSVMLDFGDLDVAYVQPATLLRMVRQGGWATFSVPPPGHTQEEDGDRSADPTYGAVGGKTPLGDLVRFCFPPDPAATLQNYNFVDSTGYYLGWDHFFQPSERSTWLEDRLNVSPDTPPPLVECSNSDQDDDVSDEPWFDRGEWPLWLPRAMWDTLQSIEADLPPKRFHLMFDNPKDLADNAKQFGLDDPRTADLQEWVDLWEWAREPADHDTEEALHLQAEVRRRSRLKMFGATPAADVSATLCSVRTIPLDLGVPPQTKGGVRAIAPSLTKKQERKAAKFEGYRTTLYNVYLAAGARGVHWMDLDSDDSCEERRVLFVARIQNFKADALAPKLSAWRRWEQWCAQNSVPPFRPSPMKVSKYIIHRSEKGPSVANSVFHDLQWIETHMGIQLCTSESSVKSLSSIRDDNTDTVTKQAEVATPSLHTRAVDKLRSMHVKQETGTVATLIRLVMIWAIGCIRFKHGQDSKVTKTTARFIHYRCRAGKRRVKGRQVPFDWVVPRIIAPGIDLWQGVDELYAGLLAQGCVPSFWLPDLAASKWEDVSAETEWLPQPMPYDKAQRMLRGVGSCLGFAAAWVKLWTSYTPRRWAPTCGEAIGFSDPQQQALGNWVDIPNNANKAPTSGATFLMSRHYAANNDVMAGDVKGLMLVSLYLAFEAHDGAQAPVQITADCAAAEIQALRQLHAVYSPAAIEKMWFSCEWAAKVHDSEVPPPSAVHIRTAQEISAAGVQENGSAAVVKSLAPTQDDAPSPSNLKSTELVLPAVADAESSSSDSQSSDDASASSDAPDQDASQCWFIQKEQAVTHFTMFRESNRLVPYCRERGCTPFDRPPVLQGDMYDLHHLTGRTQGAHIACFRRISTHAQEAWRRAFTDHEGGTGDAVVSDAE